MKRILFLSMFFNFCLIAPLKANDLATLPAFTVKAIDLKEWCELNEDLCELWIQGVMEGMEFAAMFILPTEMLKDRNVFCIKDDDTYMDEIRTDFMEYISKEESNMMLKKPAVISLAVAFDKYLCR